MESELKIQYYISDMFDREFVTDSREEALASFEEGKFVYEAHITTWRVHPSVSGKNEVQYEWH